MKLRPCKTSLDSYVCFFLTDWHVVSVWCTLLIFNHLCSASPASSFTGLSAGARAQAECGRTQSYPSLLASSHTSDSSYSWQGRVSCTGRRGNEWSWQRSWDFFSFTKREVAAGNARGHRIDATDQRQGRTESCWEELGAIGFSFKFSLE